MTNLWKKILTVFILISSSAYCMAAKKNCEHKDGIWLHKFVPGEAFDIAVIEPEPGVEIYLGGMAGQMQVINIDGVSTNAIKSGRFTGNFPGNGVSLPTVAVTISTDIHAKKGFTAIYSDNNLAKLTIPFKDLMHYVSKSRYLYISIPLDNGKTKKYDIDISKIPLGTEHDCLY
ncbi:hypothetical protein EKN38_22360 [Enterobacter sp. WCHEn045836]|uniref:hypothetical protein n=1 Tax=Enterobacter sp. WCHEn045836 TaxID=2497434 RepID=UPI000F84716C|nr:hypothetical protein [Enterobacter sp. WCHEn045836]RTP97285.1 hypothetical protein EKN38_22360 [Enterobacter sp. WCHEn045836]